jgi:hypothetical protein
MFFVRLHIEHRTLNTQLCLQSCNLHIHPRFQQDIFTFVGLPRPLHDDHNIRIFALKYDRLPILFRDYG